MYTSQSNQASVFWISGIPTCNQGLDKCYQPWPSAWLVTHTLTLIIPDITNIESYENCFIIHCFEETLYTEPQNTLALLLWKQGDYQRAFHSVAGLMRALMYYYTYSMRCNWWFWEKPLGIFKFSVSSFNFCVCRSVKIQNGNDNNVLHLVLTTSSSVNIEALMIKICFAQWPDNYNNYISTIIVVNCCTALY